MRDQVMETAETEEAWGKEIEQRLAAYDCGEVQAIDGEEILAKARAPAQ